MTLAELRAKVGLTQADLARMCGVSRQVIQQLEAGKQQDVKFQLGLRMADALQVTPHFLGRVLSDG